MIHTDTYIQKREEPIDFIERTAAERVGSRIREIRLSKGLTQIELGEKVGLPADRIRQYEGGYRKPKTDVIKAIASALDVQPLALIDPVSSNYLGAIFALFELEKLYGLDLVKTDGTYSLQFRSDSSQSLVKYLDVWYEALLQYKKELSMANDTSEADAALKNYNSFKWSLSELLPPKETIELEILNQEEQLARLRELLDAYNEE